MQLCNWKNYIIKTFLLSAINVHSRFSAAETPVSYCLHLLFCLIWASWQVFWVSNIHPHNWTAFLYLLSSFIMSGAKLGDYFTCGMGGWWPCGVQLAAKGAIFNMGLNFRSQRGSSTIPCFNTILTYCAYYDTFYVCKLFFSSVFN